MNKPKGRFDHLINNLERISSRNSIFNYKCGKRALLSLCQENFDEWLDRLLPTTRIILEPKIIGSSIGIQYINGILTKAITKNSDNITEKVKSLKDIPKKLPIKQRIEICGVLYNHEKKLSTNKTREIIEIHKPQSKENSIKFCAFHIYHCKINHFQSLQELKDLNFEVPQSQFTNFISDIEIYRQCWREGKLFEKYPNDGIVLKINSRKLQKYLQKNKLSIDWAYAIN